MEKILILAVYSEPKGVDAVDNVGKEYSAFEPVIKVKDVEG